MPQFLLELKMFNCEPFYPLLQQGVTVHCRVGCPLGDLLSEQWGIDPEYVRKRVTTIFLNSRAIDNVDTAMVGPGATIALSGAMPGLVGATMRRGGHLAAMRGAMTYQGPSGPAGEQVAPVRIKLFNLLLRELGPGFLKRGIWLSGSELAAFFREHVDAAAPPWSAATMNGMPMAPAALAGNVPFDPTDTIRVTVEAG